ncbi:MAG: sigma-70 family RNA polymerase sigma factor [Bacteroidota bacterium]
MGLLGRGDIAAFDELYDRYSGRLLRYFHRMLGRDEEKSQDFLQDIFLRIVERPELFSSDRRFSTWIFSVAHNMCKNEYRRAMVRQSVDIELDDIPLEGGEIIEEIDREQFLNMLSLELDLLDDDRRTTFILRHQEGLSIREISEIIGCPEGTVKSRLFNTARKLAERLDRFNPHSSTIDYEQTR